LLLHLGGGLFHFWREAHVAVVLHAGTGRDEASNNDVLFQSSQVINLTLNGGFGENARCLLERRCGAERICLERSFHEAQQPTTARISCGFAGPSMRGSPARTRSPSCTLM